MVYVTCMQPECVSTTQDTRSCLDSTTYRPVLLLSPQFTTGKTGIHWAQTCRRAGLVNGLQLIPKRSMGTYMWALYRAACIGLQSNTSSPRYAQ